MNNLLKRLDLSFFKNYGKNQFTKDFQAGITVGIIALPQALAFAMLANLPPEWGLYAAIVAGLIAAIFGGSEHNVTGPTSALAVALSLVVAAHGQNMVLLLAVMIGAVQIVLALARAGTLVKFIPQPVLVGFSSGVALLIFASQFPKIFDVSIGSSESFIEIIEKVWHHMYVLGEGSIYAFLIASIVIATIFGLLSFKKTKNLPIPLIALLLGTFSAILFEIKLKTIGVIPSSLPSFYVAQEVFTFENVKLLIPTAFALGLLASVESLATAQIASKMTGVRFNTNMELFGQGLANLFAGFFKGIPSTGSFSRTAANVRSGAQTRVSAIIHSLFLIIIVLVFSGYSKFIPIAVLSGILLTVAVRMIEVHHIKMILKSTKSDIIIFIATLMTTLVFNLIDAIMVGIFLAIILALRKASDKSCIKEVTSENGKLTKRTENLYCPQTQLIQLDAPLFFGISSNFEDELKKMRKDEAKVLILRMKNVPYIDASGIASLEDVYSCVNRRGGHLIVAGVTQKVEEVLKRTGLYKKIGKKNFMPNTLNAITFSYNKYFDKKKCQNCKYRVFSECREEFKAENLN